MRGRYRWHDTVADPHTPLLAPFGSADGTAHALRLRIDLPRMADSCAASALELRLPQECPYGHFIRIRQPHRLWRVQIAPVHTLHRRGAPRDADRRKTSGSNGFGQRERTLPSAKVDFSHSTLQGPTDAAEPCKRPSVSTSLYRQPVELYKLSSGSTEPVVP